MGEYLVPDFKRDWLEKQVSRIRNKGINVTFNVLEEHVSVPVDQDNNANSLAAQTYIDCARIEIEGTYIINGWRFIGVIEHLQPRNVIRLADDSFSLRIPDRYWTVGRECEHCHLRRDRSDTYLVYNEDLDEFKQVGKTCLQGYTNGLNAETCAAMAEMALTLDNIDQAIEDGDSSFFASSRGFSLRYAYDTDAVRKKAFIYVKRHGYIPRETGWNFVEALERGDLANLPDASPSDIAAVGTYLRNAYEKTVREGSSYANYFSNAMSIWNSDYFQPRDGGLITSAVQSYFRDIERQKTERRNQAAREAQLANTNQTAAGNVGDKVDFTVTDFRILYYRDRGSYYGGSYPVYRLVGSDGRIYIWACSNGTDVVEGMHLRGTVKRISEFRGETQTEVTRCKEIP